MKWIWLAAIVCACAKPDSIQCGTVTCSSLSVCVGDNQCVLQTQVDACAGKPELANCSYPGENDGICHETACIPAGCGNGVIEPGELCDDGNHFGGDGCSANCKSKEVCGDGAVDPIIGETCDHGDANSDAIDTTCHTNCQVPHCGDKIVDPGEFCDDGNTTPGDGCNATCTGRWTTMPTSTYARLMGVWATADGSVAFAVGLQGTILRFDATTAMWTPMVPPGPVANRSQDYQAVWGTSVNDVWAVSANTGPADLNGRIDHFDGTSWSVSYALSSHYWRAVWASPTSGPRVVGSLPGNPPSAHSYATLSTTWGQTQLLSGSGLTSLLRVFSVDNGNTMYATDGNGNVFTCTGTGTTTPGCGANWTNITGATPSMKTARALWGTSSTNMYGFSDHLVTISGSTITPVPNTDSILGGAFASSMSGAGSQLIVVGDGGRISVFDGTKWTASPPPVGTTYDLEGVFMIDDKHAFVVGDSGTILY